MTSLVILSFAIFVATYGSAVMPGVIGHLSAETGISLADVGRSSAMFGLVYAAAAPSFAWLLRKHSRYAVLVVALVAVAVSMVALGFVRTAGQLYALRAVQAVLTAVVLPASVVLAGTLVPRERRSQALSIAYTGLVVSSLIGAPLGEAVARQYSTAVVFGLGAAIAIAAVFTLVAARAVFADHTASEPTPGPTASGTGWVASSVIVVCSVLAAAFTESGGTAALSTFSAPYLESVVGASGVVLPVLLLCYGIGGLLGNAASGLVADRVGPVRVIVLTHVVAAVAVLGLMWAANLWIVAVLLVVWGFASWAINPALQALILTYGGRHMNVLVGVNSSSIYAGSALGAWVAAASVDAVGLAVLPVVAAISFAATAVAGLVAAAAIGRQAAPVVSAAVN